MFVSFVVALTLVPVAVVLWFVLWLVTPGLPHRSYHRAQCAAHAEWRSLQLPL